MIIVEIKLTRENGNVIVKFKANALSPIVQKFYDPIIEDENLSPTDRALLSFEYTPEVKER